MTAAPTLAPETSLRPGERVKPIDRILRKLPSAVPLGNGYMACCPSHDDKTPSLSIGEGDDGRVLLHCFTGCPHKEICAALDMSPAELFPEEPDGRYDREADDSEAMDNLYLTPDLLIEQLERRHGPA